MPQFKEKAESNDTQGQLAAWLASPVGKADLLLVSALQCSGPCRILVASSKTDRVRHFMAVERSKDLVQAAAMLNLVFSVLKP